MHPELAEIGKLQTAVAKRRAGPRESPGRKFRKLAGRRAAHGFPARRGPHAVRGRSLRLRRGTRPRGPPAPGAAIPAPKQSPAEVRKPDFGNWKLRTAVCVRARSRFAGRPWPRQKPAAQCANLQNAAKAERTAVCRRPAHRTSRQTADNASGPPARVKRIPERASKARAGTPKLFFRNVALSKGPCEGSLTLGHEDFKGAEALFGRRA